MTLKLQKPRGQALLMVTLALFAMFGLIGLSVDFGWAFFVQKSAQAAADAAALAAVRMAYVNATTTASYSCGGTVAACAATPLQCPSSGTLPLNLQGACIYAARNGFSTTNSRQNVLVQASDANTPPTVNPGCNPAVAHPPTAPCVDTVYWVTVRVSESVPQLFSAVLGNTNALIAARATAAVAESEIIGSLILLNRENDPWIEATGTNLYLGGSPVVNVPGGILLSSNSATAGAISGSGQVVSPFTYIRTPGNITVSGGGSWTAPPTTRSDGSMFWDPFRNKVQPPLLASPTALPSIPITETNGGKAILDASVAACSTGVCPPANYYAVNSSGVPTGTQIDISSNISFAGVAPGMSTMGLYVFWGGLNIGQANVNFGPGQYVMAGVKNSGTTVFDNNNKALLTSNNASAGIMFILTDDSYEGQLNAAATSLSIPNLQFGSAGIKAGNNAGSGVQLYGLDTTMSEVINAGLQDYPVVIWQDRLNSNIKYLPDGNLDLSCAATGTATGGAPSINNPCINPNSPVRQLEMWATPNTNYDGVIYQPRGSWTLLQASGNYAGALRIISGGLKTQGSGNLTLTSPSVPVTQLTTALVE